MKKILTLALLINYVMSPLAFAESCKDFLADKVLRCTPYKCEDTVGQGPDQYVIKREVIGKEADKCHYKEYHPGREMDCHSSLSLISAVIQFYQDNIDNTSGKLSLTYIVDGKEVANPFQEAFANGSCVWNE